MNSNHVGNNGTEGLAKKRALTPYEHNKLWRKRHPEQFKATRYKYGNPATTRARKARFHARQSSNLEYVMVRRLRSRIRYALKGAQKSKGATALLGCSLPSFLIYLQTRFQPGMTLANYGEWELDHVIPCALFDLTKPDQQKVCFHFSNIQPMWAADNRKKSARLFTQEGFLKL